MKKETTKHNRRTVGEREWEAVSPEPMWLPFGLSLFIHLAIAVILVFSPSFLLHHSSEPAVISVTMVSLPGPPGPAQPEPSQPPGPKPEQEVTSPPEPEPESVPEPRVEKPPEPQVEKKVVVKEEKPPVEKPESDAISVSRKNEYKPKKSLKKKTFKPSSVVKKAINRIENNVEANKPDPLQSAFDRLRREVAKKRPGTAAASGGSAAAGGGGAGGGGGRQAELIDIYRYEVALQVQQNWAYSEQLAKSSKSLRVTIAFKVMPNGEIRDVFFDDRSGNRLLDESAYRAIMKANPVKPHPPGILSPYVEVGLRFSPEGIQ